jgi:ribosomal protein S27E
MTDTQPTHRYCVVQCLGCRNPIPLFAEPIEDSAAAATGAGESQDRAFFRAWCNACGREYPYLAESRIWMQEPPLDKQQRQMVFPPRRKVHARGAHA